MLCANSFFPNEFLPFFTMRSLHRKPTVRRARKRTLMLAPLLMSASKYEGCLFFLGTPSRVEKNTRNNAIFYLSSLSTFTGPTRHVFFTIYQLRFQTLGDQFAERSSTKFVLQFLSNNPRHPAALRNTFK